MKRWMIIVHQRKRQNQSLYTPKHRLTCMHSQFYRNMKQSKEMRGFSMSSMGTESIPRLDSTSPTAVSPVWEPRLRWLPISLFLKHGRCLLELLFGLGGLRAPEPLFLTDDSEELTAFLFGLGERFKTLSCGALANITLHLSPWSNLLLGDGDDLKVLLGSEYAEFGLSGWSLLKLFCLTRTGELARTLFCGVDPATLCGGLNCLAGATIGDDLTGDTNLGARNLLDTDFTGLSLVESLKITCGFSLTQDHKNSFEKDLSLELNTEDELAEEQELEVVLVVQEKEEIEEVEREGEGEGGLISRTEIGDLGTWETTSLSWTLISHSSKSSDVVFGLHLLMQDPIQL